MKHASFIIVAAVALVACGGDKAAAPVIVPPVLDSISPSRGTVGTLVRLNGSAFANDSVRVYFGALASPQVERQSGVLYATAPEGLVLGTRYDVRVVNRDEVTPDEMKKAQEAFRADLLNERRARFFSAYMGKAKEKMKVQVNTDVVRRVLAAYQL